MIELGSGRSWVCMDWRTIGHDLYLSVTGGEAPHICAEDLCRVTGRTVLVSCGIHIDRATQPEIALLCDHIRTLE